MISMTHLLLQVSDTQEELTQVFNQTIRSAKDIMTENPRKFIQKKLSKDATTNTEFNLKEIVIIRKKANYDFEEGYLSDETLLESSVDHSEINENQSEFVEEIVFHLGESVELDETVDGSSDEFISLENLALINDEISIPSYNSSFLSIKSDQEPDESDVTNVTDFSHSNSEDILTMVGMEDLEKSETPEIEPEIDSTDPHLKPEVYITKTQFKPEVNSPESHFKPEFHISEPNFKPEVNLSEPHLKPEVNLSEPHFQPEVHAPENTTELEIEQNFKPELTQSFLETKPEVDQNEVHHKPEREQTDSKIEQKSFTKNPEDITSEETKSLTKTTNEHEEEPIEFGTLVKKFDLFQNGQEVELLTSETNDILENSPVIEENIIKNRLVIYNSDTELVKTEETSQERRKRIKMMMINAYTGKTVTPEVKSIKARDDFDEKEKVQAKIEADKKIEKKLKEIEEIDSDMSKIERRKSASMTIQLKQSPRNSMVIDMNDIQSAMGMQAEEEKNVDKEKEANKIVKDRSKFNK
jgi:hypothetical protein